MATGGTGAGGPEPAGFVQVYAAMLVSGVPSDELHVWLVLRHHAGARRYCWVSDRTIGDAIRRSQDTASRLLGRLERRGLIRRTKVEPTAENPTGRVIEVLGVVEPRAANPRQGDRPTPAASPRSGVPQARGTPAANGRGTPAANLRDELEDRKKQQGRAAAEEGPPAPGERPDPAREALLKLAWASLSDDARGAIVERVRAANPGLARWPNLMEPLYLAALHEQAEAGQLPAAADPVPPLRVVRGG